MANDSLPALLGRRARAGTKMGVDRALSGPRLLADAYEATLPKLGEFFDAYLEGDEAPAASPAAPATVPRPFPKENTDPQLPPLKPWDAAADEAMRHAGDPVNRVVEEFRPRLSYDADGDGRLSEYRPDRAAPERLPGVRGGGTVSMMTAPENEARVTRASRMEDLEQEVGESQMLAALGDPYGLRRAEAESRMKQNPVDVRRADIVDGLSELERALAEKVRAGELTEQDAAARIAEGKARAKYYLDALKPGWPQPGLEIEPRDAG